MSDFSWSPGAITSVFRRIVGRVEPGAGAAAWRFQLHNGKPMSVSASMRGNHLCLSTTAPVPRHETPSWKLMTVNARLPAGSRFTLDGPSGSPALHVEEHIDRQSMDASVISESCELLLRAHAVALGMDGIDDVPATRSTEEESSNRDDRRPTWLEHWTDESSPASDLGGGRVGVDVETRSGRARVVVRRLANATHCSVFVAPAPASLISREAMARFLLSAIDAVPFVRAITRRESTDRVDVVHLETWLPAASNPSDVERGVFGLATACEQFASEAKALAASWLAESYSNVRPVMTSSQSGSEPDWWARTNPGRFLRGG